MIWIIIIYVISALLCQYLHQYSSGNVTRNGGAVKTRWYYWVPIVNTIYAFLKFIGVFKSL